jgi:hypothetical protein
MFSLELLQKPDVDHPVLQATPRSRGRGGACGLAFTYKTDFSTTGRPEATAGYTNDCALNRLASLTGVKSSLARSSRRGHHSAAARVLRASRSCWPK